MSDTLDTVVAELNKKLGDDGFSGSAKFVLSGVGAVMLDQSGARVADEPADMTMTADMETFQAVLAGETNPTTAFMSGQLTVDGDMGLAMQLASALS